MRNMTVWMLLALVLPASTRTIRADERFDPAARAKTVAPFIDELTVGVVHVDVSRIAVEPLFAELEQLIPEGKAKLAPAKAAAGSVISAFREAGGRDLYVVVSLADWPPEPWFVLVPLSGKVDQEALTDAVFNVLGDQRRKSKRVSERLGDFLFFGRKDTLKRLRSIRPDPRPELATAFQAAGDTAAQVLLLPPRHSRRVIEEIMPGLPEKLGGGPSTVLTQGVLWAALGVDIAEKTSLHLVVQSRDGQTAGTLRAKWVDLYGILADELKKRRIVARFDELAKILSPQVQGDRLTLTLSEQHELVVVLMDVVKPLLAAAHRAVGRNTAFNHLKQIGLGMFFYHDRHKAFPAAASYDAKGKPLLSWRVHILPYLEQQQLYEQFHLDEPWDSGHNKRLVERMPAVYRSPASKLKQKGRTNYVVPVGEGTVFDGRKGVSFRDLADGSSNTLMVVEVDDDHAVIWTRPDDLAFDPKQPNKGLGGLRGGSFIATFCDGSVRSLPKQLDRETLRRLFLRNDGKPVDIKR